MARKKGMQFIPYDYEAAYNKALEDMHEWFIENLFQHRKKVVYALSWTVRWTWRRLNPVGNSQAGMKFAGCRQMKMVCPAWRTISSKKRTVFRRKKDGTVHRD